MSGGENQGGKETMRRYLSVLLLIVLAGCAAAPHTALPVEEPDWRVEEPSWRMISTDPADYGITYDGLPDLEGWPLDKLAAYCLGADGIYAEAGFDRLYHYFLEAPHTCVAYFSLIQDEGQREILCGQIAAVDAAWYQGAEFREILTVLAQAYSGGIEGSVVQSIKHEEN